MIAAIDAPIVARRRRVAHEAYLVTEPRQLDGEINLRGFRTAQGRAKRSLGRVIDSGPIVEDDPHGSLTRVFR